MFQRTFRACVRVQVFLYDGGGSIISYTEEGLTPKHLMNQFHSFKSLLRVTCSLYMIVYFWHLFDSFLGNCLNCRNIVLLLRPVDGPGSVHNPAKSCDDVLHSVPSAQSGVFWLQAARGRPYQVRRNVLLSRLDIKYTFI